MTQYSNLLLFFCIVFGVVALPGLDMAFVMGRSLTAGRKSGLIGVGGIMAGGMCLVAMTILGISAFLKIIPAAFNALLSAGVVYIAWIGFSLVRSKNLLSTTAGQGGGSWVSTFGQGMLTILMNPKAYLFMLAIFPQFLRPESGAIWNQAAVLWLIIALTQACVYGSIALMADRARHYLATRSGASIVAARATGLVLIAAAVFTGIEGWHGL